MAEVGGSHGGESVIASIATDGLTFEEVTHTYTLKGIVLPSVTQIIRDNRLSSDFSFVSAANMEMARQLGQAVHIATHYNDEGTLDDATVDPVVLPYLNAWRQFVTDRGIEFVALEQRVADPVYQFCGTVDRIGRLVTARNAGEIVIDLKTGNPAAAGAHYQTAAYAHLVRDLPSVTRIAARWSVQLHPERAVPYSVTPYMKNTDWRIFRSALELTHERSAQGRSWREAA